MLLLQTEKQIQDRIARAIDAKVFPGCVVGVVHASGERWILPFGFFADKSSRPIEESSIFDVASITKSIPSASLALKLIEEGRISPEDQAARFLPELNNSYRNKIFIKHLLTQTLDYGIRLSAYKDRTPEEILEIIFKAELKSRPGSKFSYSNATSVLLGLVVERVYGQQLDFLSEKYFFQPLSMTRTTFHPKRFSLENIVPTEIDPWRGYLIQGEVHDESAFRLSQKYIPGSAGLFSTAPDLLNFLEMLLNEGVFQGQKIFEKATLQMMSRNWIEDIGEKSGLGWELDQKRYMGRFSSSSTIGKTGFTGCSCLVDLDKKIGLVILSNYTYPRRKPDAVLINQVRSDIADIVLSE